MPDGVKGTLRGPKVEFTPRLVFCIRYSDMDTLFLCINCIRYFQRKELVRIRYSIYDTSLSRCGMKTPNLPIT